MLRLVGDDGKPGKTVTIDEYLEAAKEKHEGKIYYTNDVAQQSQAINLLRNEEIEVAIFDLVVDSQYLAALEHYRNDLSFTRVDSGVSEVLKEAFPENNEGSEALADLFKKVSGNDKMAVAFESLKNEEIPAILSVSEESRRMEDMMKLYALGGGAEDSFPLDYSLTVNTASPLYTKLTDMIAASDDKADVLASYIYKLALLAQKKPTASELTAFLSDSYKILGMI